MIVSRIVALTNNGWKEDSLREGEKEREERGERKRERESERRRLSVYILLLHR